MPILERSGGGIDDRGHATFQLATDLGGPTIYDYWDPRRSVQRILNGEAMERDDELKMPRRLSGIQFSGPATRPVDTRAS